MIKQQIGPHIYVALALATLTAIMSFEHPADPSEPVRFLLLTIAPEAATAAGAIGEDLDAVMPR